MLRQRKTDVFNNFDQRAKFLFMGCCWPLQKHSASCSSYTLTHVMEELFVQTSSLNLMTFNVLFRLSLFNDFMEHCSYVLLGPAYQLLLFSYYFISLPRKVLTEINGNQAGYRFHVQVIKHLKCYNYQAPCRIHNLRFNIFNLELNMVVFSISLTLLR